MTPERNSAGFSAENEVAHIELSGIQDLDFYLFMKKVQDSIEYLSDGSVDERPTIKKIISHLYGANDPEYEVTTNLINDARQKFENLNYADLYKYKKRGTLGRSTDKESIINGFTYLFAEKRIRQEKKKSRMRVSVSAGLKKGAELWGDNPRSERYRKISIMEINKEAEKASSDVREVIRVPKGQNKYYWGNESGKTLEEKLEALDQSALEAIYKKAYYQDAVDHGYRRSEIKFQRYKIDQEVGRVIEYIRLANDKKLNLLNQDKVRGINFLKGVQVSIGYIETSGGRVNNLGELYKRVVEKVREDPRIFGIEE